MKKTLLLFAFLPAFCFNTNAQVLDQSYTNGAGATYTNGPYGPSQGTGQSFTAGITGPLSEIVVNVSALTTPGTLDVRVFAGNTYSGTALATQSFTVSAIGPYAMYLNPGVNVTSGSQYTFILSNPTGPSAGDFSFTDDFNGTYAGGTEWYQGAASAGRDMRFLTYVGGVPVEEHSAASIELSAFPNPFTDYLKITTSNAVTSVEVFDMVGNSVQKVSCQNGVAEINMADLSEGIYFIEVKSSTGIAIKKVVKQN